MSSKQENKLVVNSSSYWNDRFEHDWKAFGGNEQTAYFASLLNEMLPEWLINQINEYEYEICDLGCAEGDALSVYRQIFLKSRLYGEDFSKAAIEIATEKYPQFDFKVSNIMEPEKEKTYPVIICSNVIEHFSETYTVLKNLFQRSQNYTILLFPYCEEKGVIKEHEKSFHTKDIPIQVDDNYLIFARTVQCDSVLYPYEQMLLVYSKNKKHSLLSDFVEYVKGDKEKEQEDKNRRELETTKETVKELQNIIKESQDAIEELQSTVEKCNETVEKKNSIALQYQALLKQSEEEKENIVLQYQTLLKQYEDEKKYWNNAQQKLNYLADVLKQKDEYLVQAQVLCNHFATGKLMQLNHFMFRMKGQLFKGTKEERKEFWSWMNGRIKKTNRSIGEGKKYNPWMVVNEKLREALACTNMQQNGMTGSDSAARTMESGKSLSLDTQKLLQQNYTSYDVIILSVIDYDFRHQRPQHFASRFAANGHRVYYVNANFIRPYSITTKQENLYVVDFSCKESNAIYSMNGEAADSWMKENLSKLVDAQAIRDAVVVVDYPNWVSGAEYLKKQYGFKIVTDYMDDYTGFLGTAEDFLKDNCIKLLKDSDLVAASSQFLYDVASKHTEAEKIIIVRNGTEVEHFYQAIELQKPDKPRKVIGYYGAVSHWFAWEKVCYLAKKFQDCDLVIVGAVTEHEDKLKKYSNIKLLGEKPYSELPKYLADFDVCLIPFDTSTDLIKATNPVKFYEYLSAGKKVVATDIPELEPYRNEYVYMSNEDEKFAEYVGLCLEGKDALKDEEACICFAKENDWQQRYESFAEGCRSTVPKVSIIVLTYNNLDYNKKCIDSILCKTAYANYELIIVDNCSSDGTVDYLHELNGKSIPNVKIIFNQQNTGFAGGNNIGIEAATGDYILLLNNDTVVTRGWLTALVKHLENNKQLGMCNPVTNSIGNESKIAVKYSGEAEMDAFAYLYTMKHMGEEFADVDRLPLFATIIRREALDKVGLLDEEYKIGMFEDDDYTERILQAGYQIVIAEDAFIHHINNGSFKKLDDEEYRKIFEANKTLFEKKWNKKWTMPKYREGVDWDTNLNHLL